MNDHTPATIAEAYAELRRMLAGRNIEDPAREARLILRHGGYDSADLIASPDRRMPPQHWAGIAAIATRRGAGEPLSRIRGSREFMGRDFIVTPDVLDPRPDTEILVETALLGPAATRVLDLGTGSGCVLVSLLCAWPDAVGTAVDISPDALAVAAANAAQHGVADRMIGRVGSWYDALRDKRPFDLIVSNPPYIPSEDIGHLTREVREHDPMPALDGGPDGLDAYRAILQEGASFLTEGGRLIVELGYGQADPVRKIAIAAGFSDIETYLDLSGVTRVIAARRG